MLGNGPQDHSVPVSYIISDCAIERDMPSGLAVALQLPRDYTSALAKLKQYADTAVTDRSEGGN